MDESSQNFHCFPQSANYPCKPIHTPGLALNTTELNYVYVDANAHNRRISLTSSSNVSLINCDQCNTKGSSIRCIDCNVFICEQCSTEHINNDLTKSHEIKKLPSPIGTSPKEVNSNTPSPPKRQSPMSDQMCLEHNETLSFVCEECKKLVCQGCTMYEHRDHNSVLLENFFEQINQRIEIDLEQCRLNSKCFKDSIDVALLNIQLAEKNSHEVIENIRKSFRETSSIFDQREAFLLDALEKLHKKRINTLNMQMAGLKSAVEGLAQLAETLRDMAEGKSLMEQKHVAYEILHCERQLIQFNQTLSDLLPKYEKYTYNTPPESELRAFCSQYTTLVEDTTPCVGRKSDEMNTQQNDIVEEGEQAAMTLGVTSASNMMSINGKRAIVGGRSSAHILSSSEDYPLQQWSQQQQQQQQHQQQQQQPQKQQRQFQPIQYQKPFRLQSNSNRSQQQLNMFLPKQQNQFNHQKPYYTLAERQQYQQSQQFKQSEQHNEPHQQKQKHQQQQNQQQEQPHKQKDQRKQDYQQNRIINHHNHHQQQHHHQLKRHYKRTLPLNEYDAQFFNIETGRVNYFNCEWNEIAIRAIRLHQQQPSNVMPGLGHSIILQNTTASNTIHSFATDGTDDGKLSRPWGICSDRFGNILVADRRNNRIQIFNSEGILINKFGKKGDNDGEFELPTGIAVDVDDRIIVVDKDNHRVQIFKMNGEFILKFGGIGKDFGRFEYPWDVAVNCRSQIVVTDSRNNRIQQFDSGGRFIRHIVFDGIDGIREMPSPRGICYTPQGTIIVTDFNNHCLYLINPDSNQILVAKGKEGDGDLEFRRPSGVCCDDQGNIVVADSKNQRVVVYNAKLEYSHQIDIGPSVGNLPPTLNPRDRVCDLTITSEGRLAFLLEASPECKDSPHPDKPFVYII